MSEKSCEGKIVRISGPIIHASGLESAGLYDVVEVGENRLTGEIIRQEGESATIQVYEDDTGLKIGERVVALGRPLSVKLGPGLAGAIYDGIQRPLKNICQDFGAFLTPGVKSEVLESQKKWDFVAEKTVFEGSAIFPGFVLGTVQETSSLLQRILVPPNIRGRILQKFLGGGKFSVDDVIAKTELGEEIKLSHFWPVRKARPFLQKLSVSEPLVTGQRVIDVFFPLSKGGTAAIPGGFGTGKTMTQHAVAKWCDADVIVYIGCGERGNEMTEVLSEFPNLVDPRTNRSIMERTILIANTSNMPVAAREVSLYSGITIAEFYRDMGLHVAIMADSTSRWAEALRELSGRMEEMPAEEGFPAYLPTRLASFYERAGRIRTLSGSEGSVSIIGAVSPPGGDFSEPVTQHTKRFIRCFWALDRELANARHYPAIGWIDSYSEYAEEIRAWWENREPRWSVLRQKALALLKTEERLQQIVRLIGPDSLPDNEKLVLITAEMLKTGFLQQSAFDDEDKFCDSKKQIAILDLILEFYERALDLIKSGVILSKIVALPVRSKIVRMKSECKNGDDVQIQKIRDELSHELDALERLGFRA